MNTAGGDADAKVETKVTTRSSGGKSWFRWSSLLRQQPFSGSANDIADYCVPATPASPRVSFRPRLELKNWFFLGGAEIMDVDISPPEAAFNRIPTSGGPNIHKQPSPAEHIRSMASPTTSDESRPSSSPEDAAPKHDSAVDLPGDARKANRISVSFPIQPSALGVEHASAGGRRASPSPLFDPTFAFPTQVPHASTSTQPSPTDNGFLTALAAQERRVLELKEELQRAEQELDKLKRQWAAQESAKKRQDAHHAQPLQSINTDLASIHDDDIDGSSAWTQKEMEKKKSFVSGSKATHRRVFSGSKHTRALSLLSPEKMNQKSFSPPTETQQLQSSGVPRASRPLVTTRVNTAPDLLEQIRNTNTMDDITSPVSDTPKEAFRISRQMAADFREGLWTFFEDLRQAAVGDEGVVGPPKTDRSSMKPPSKPTRSGGPKKPHKKTASEPFGPRTTPTRPPHSPPTTNSSPKAASKNSPSRSRPAVSRRQSAEFWVKESPKVTGLRKKTQAAEKDTKHVNSHVEEPWDMWDTPEKQSTPARSRSSTSQATSTPTSTAATSPTNALKATDVAKQSKLKDTPKGKRVISANGDRKDAIPWPALQKLTPGNLKKTASNLMSEWEKSLTPPPESKRSGEDYLSWPSPMNP